MYSTNSFNSSYHFADSLCYISLVPPPISNNKGCIHSFSTSQLFSPVSRSLSYDCKRSYAWTSDTIPVKSEKKKQFSSFLGLGKNSIDYDMEDSDNESDIDSDSDSDSDFDNESDCTLNNDNNTILSSSVVPENTTKIPSILRSSTVPLLKPNSLPSKKKVSFSDQVVVIKSSDYLKKNNNKKNALLKKVLKAMKIKK